MVGAAYMYTVADFEEGDGADSVDDGGRCWRTVLMVLMGYDGLCLQWWAVAVPQRCNSVSDR